MFLFMSVLSMNVVKSPRATLDVVGMLRIMSNRACPLLFIPGPVSVSVFVALSTVFHCIIDYASVFLLFLFCLFLTVERCM